MAGRGGLLGQKKRYGNINEKVKMMFFRPSRRSALTFANHRCFEKRVPILNFEFASGQLTRPLSPISETGLGILLSSADIPQFMQ